MKISSRQVHFFSLKVYKGSTLDAITFWYIHKRKMKNIPHQMYCMALPNTNFYFQTLQLLLLWNWRCCDGTTLRDWGTRHISKLQASLYLCSTTGNQALVKQISQALATQYCKSNVFSLGGLSVWCFSGAWGHDVLTEELFTEGNCSWNKCLVFSSSTCITDIWRNIFCGSGQLWSKGLLSLSAGGSKSAQLKTRTSLSRQVLSPLMLVCPGLSRWICKFADWCRLSDTFK